MERLTARDFDPAVLKLFDQYVHGQLSRRGFLDGAARYTTVGTTAAGLLAGLPGDAVMALIRKHPTAVVLAALMLGYTLIKDPGRAMRQLQSMVLAIL